MENFGGRGLTRMGVVGDGGLMGNPGLRSETWGTRRKITLVYIKKIYIMTI